MSSSLYDRVAIEGLMDELIGRKNISEAMTDELLVVAYDYNSKQPRFYSKHFAEMDAGIYDVQMSKATGGSSAAPIFFEP
jgi:patatin-like phospholipase/acyl hydrolase